jgi:hypothetical protein
MGCASYCETGLETHDLVPCGQYKLGGVSAIIIGACGAVLAVPTDPIEIQALLTSGDAVLVEDIRFALPAGSPIQVDSPVGCGTQIRINEDRTATLYDANVTDQNNSFYNSLNSQKVGWIMAYLCDSGNVIYIDPPVGITTSANFIIPEQNNELQRYEVTFSWRQKEIPTQFAAPAGIFS